MSTLVTQAPLLVTGANGFIASHLVKDLLAAGYRVRGTVRNPAKGAEHLLAFPGASERLELVAAELTTPGAFDAAMAGVTHVLHTASPYALTVKDPQKDLVDPAVQGTRSVLAAAAKAGTVRKVVLTSSMAAITDEPETGRVLSEKDWNEKSSLTRNPYYFSKVLAEKEAWRFVEQEKPGFELVAINPFVVLGPAFGPQVNSSNQVLVDLYQGTYPGLLSITWGMVDVRDVARAHVLALENPKAQGRYLCSAHTVSMRALVDLIRSRGWDPQGKLPTLSLDGPVGDALVGLLSYLQPAGVGSYLRTHLGRVPSFDNSKVQRELGLSFRSLEQTIQDTLEDLRRWKHLT